MKKYIILLLIFYYSTITSQDYSYYQYDTDGYAQEVVVQDQYMYIADDFGGLKIIDISDLEDIKQVGSWDTNGYCKGLSIVNEYAFLADTREGLRIINISDVTNPVEVGFYKSGGTAWNVFVVNNYVYIADEYHGLSIIDATDVSNPFEVGFYNTECGTYDVHVKGNYAYITDRGCGLRIIDISDVEQPIEVGFYDIPFSNTLPYDALNIYVEGTLAYIGYSLNGLRVIDVSDVNNPIEVGHFDAIANDGVYVKDNFVYFCSGYGLHKLDANNLEQVGALPFTYAENLCIQNNLIYLAGGREGIYIFPIENITDVNINDQLPKEFILHNNYPNPFNPTTTIKYSVPTNVKVNLNVYDLLGKKVKTLVNQIQSAGSYNVVFDASNLTSGVYLYKITAGKFQSTKKLMLLK